MKTILALFLICISLSSCYQAGLDDDLRGVPVTNNPNLLPKTGQTAQAPGIN